MANKVGGFTFRDPVWKVLLNTRLTLTRVREQNHQKTRGTELHGHREPSRGCPHWTNPSPLPALPTCISAWPSLVQCAQKNEATTLHFSLAGPGPRLCNVPLHALSTKLQFGSFLSQDLKTCHPLGIQHLTRLHPDLGKVYTEHLKIQVSQTP